MRNGLIGVLLAGTVAMTLAACSDDGGHDEHGASSIPASEDFNQPDVDFATDMIQHHAQALVMVDLVDARSVSPELTDLAERIRMAQAPEIETMVDWLNDWDQPVPETVRDHVNAHGHDDSAAPDPGDMPGMMSAEEMAAQEAEIEEMERLLAS